MSLALAAGGFVDYVLVVFCCVDIVEFRERRPRRLVENDTEMSKSCFFSGAQGNEER